MIDLSKLDTMSGSEEGRPFEPLDLSGKKIGMRIYVYGPDSKKYAQLKEDIQRDYYRMAAETANGITPELSKKTEAEKEAEFYARMTYKWESITSEPITWDGKPFDYSYDNALTLYLKVANVRTQCQRFVESRRNFTKPEYAD